MYWESLVRLCNQYLEQLFSFKSTFWYKEIKLNEINTSRTEEMTYQAQNVMSTTDSSGFYFSVMHQWRLFQEIQTVCAGSLDLPFLLWNTSWRSLEHQTRGINEVTLSSVFFWSLLCWAFSPHAVSLRCVRYVCICTCGKRGKKSPMVLCNVTSSR